jgi:hypothetical protein
MGAGSANADGEFGLFDGIGVKRALDDVRAALQRSEADAEVAVARFLAVYRAALDVPATAADWDLLDPLETLQRSMVAMGEDLGASTLVCRGSADRAPQDERGVELARICQSFAQGPAGCPFPRSGRRGTRPIAGGAGADAGLQGAQATRIKEQ